MNENLTVTSHVGRDLLQSAALFRHEHTVVWEYVSNGLEYINPGTKPLVLVRVEENPLKISIQDHGRGMSFEDLHRYFQMHGENIDRRKGRAGRGLFGTGKSAAFGIAKALRVRTVNDGLRSEVSLTRADVEAVKSGGSIPVRVLERNVRTTEDSGTLIEITDIQLAKIDIRSIIKHVERHIAHWPGATVYINQHACEYSEPPWSNENTFLSAGTPFEAALGQVSLVLRIAKAPLEEEFQGISILSNGIWHETSLAGSDRKPFANYIFGHIDVPALSSDSSPITPYDMSRSMRLNVKNPLVAQIYAFIGMHIEASRHELERADRARRREEDAKRLEREASEIAQIINTDFGQQKSRMKDVVSTTKGNTDIFQGTVLGDDESEGLVAGNTVNAEPLADLNGPGVLGGRGTGDEAAARGATMSELDGGSPTADRRQITSKATRKSGGFRVDFIHMGKEERRAKYERENRVINVNLDHPQIEAAAKLGIEEDTFRRLAYEVAFSEYAIALAVEKAGADFYIDVTEPITDIRETVNRLATAAVTLYKAKGEFGAT